LAEAGHPVVLGARRVDKCEAVASEIVSNGGEAKAIRVDLADGESIERFVAEATKAVGDIEIMVSNAGASSPESAIEADPESFAGTLEVNLLAPHHLTWLVARPMVERHRGDLVFVTSETVRAPRPGASAYVSSKWGLEGFARSLQMELEGTGVRASIIQPGQTLTEMGSAWDADKAADVLESWIHWGLARHGSFLRPASVAAAVLSAVSVPRGAHLAMIEVLPEAPVDLERSSRTTESRRSLPEQIGGGT
jgi:NADP-dependent 3-hydroxy acid dehydrogenase YdfG